VESVLDSGAYSSLVVAVLGDKISKPVRYLLCPSNVGQQTCGYQLLSADLPSPLLLWEQKCACGRGYKILSTKLSCSIELKEIPIADSVQHGRFVRED